MTMKLFLRIASMLLLASACGGQDNAHNGSVDSDGGNGAAGEGGWGGSGGAGGASGSGGSGADGGGGAAGAGGTAGNNPGTSDAGGTPTVCSSNAFWTNGDRGSASMHPGNACITCHATNSKAPKLTIAGTVYPTTHEPNDCNGAKGTGSSITVVVTDATGKQLSPIVVNGVGNFYSTTAIAAPFHVKVVSNGKENAMMESPPNGDCDSCHTERGVNNAPGRIVVP
jgi:hypothetical protein